jgi:hypothetical protein
MHEREVARIVDRTVVLVDGRVESDTAGGRTQAAPKSAAE